MTTRGEDGYILASAIGVLLAISIVAAALVGASGDALSATRRAEADAQHSTLLQSALVVVGTQLLLEPRRRQIDLEGLASFDVLERRAKARITWEARKLDVNRAEAEAIRTLLNDRDVTTALREKVVAAAARSQAAGTPLRLLTDFGLDRAEEDCLASLLTVFGGLDQFDPEILQATSQIGRPAAGARLTVDLALEGEEQDGLAAVILITRNPTRPFKVLDWRRTSSLAGDPCDVA